MELVSPPPTKKKCFGKFTLGQELVKDVRPFNLTQQYPSRNIGVKSADNDKSTANPGNSGPAKDAAVENKLHRLKLKSSDGKDLGEFKVTLMPAKNGMQMGKTVMISKSQLTKLDSDDNQQIHNTDKISDNASPQHESVKKIQSKDVSSTTLMKELQSQYVIKQIMPQKENCNRLIRIAPRNIPQKQQISSQHRPLILKKKVTSPSTTLSQPMKKIIMSGQSCSPMIQQTVKLIPVNSVKLSPGNNVQNPYPIKKAVNSDILKSLSKDMDIPKEQQKQMQTESRAVIIKEQSKQAQSENKPVVIKSYARNINKNVVVTVSNKTADEITKAVKNNLNVPEGVKQNGIFHYNAAQTEINKNLEQEKGKNMDEKSGQKDLLHDINIIEKALSCVTDKELREKALKALAECGIGIERQVPIRPPPDMKSINDTPTQTEVFGIMDPEDFIVVSEDSENIERKKTINERISPGSSIQHRLQISGKPFTLNNNEILNYAEELDKIIDQFLDPSAAEMQQKLKRTRDLSETVLEQWKKDFNAIKNYDENGFLGIHNAVLNDNTKEFERYLAVLKLCKMNIDVKTNDVKSQTSLELAIEYDTNVDIIKLLLNSKASPISTDFAHDSALVIACKKLSPHIPLLVKYVPDIKYINVPDLDGFTPLHHCSKLGNLEGVNALLKAGADVNLQDTTSGRTALFHALENRHIEVGRSLLNHGAISNIPNNSGHTIVSLVDEFKSYSLRAAIHKAIR